MSDDDPGFRVTLKDVYQVASETSRQLNEALPILKGYGEQHKDHEARIRKLEAQRWLLVGGILVVPALIQILNTTHVIP